MENKQLWCREETVTLEKQNRIIFCQPNYQEQQEQFGHLLNEPVDKLIELIANCMQTNTTKTNNEVLYLLNSTIKLENKHTFQVKAHLFLPRVCTLLNSPSPDTQSKCINYLISISDFGKLNKESVEIIIKEEVSKIVNLLKISKGHQRKKLIILVGNLAIENSKIRDEFIQQQVENHFQDEDQFTNKGRKNQDNVKTQIFALSALCLGSPLPHKPSAQKMVERITGDKGLMFHLKMQMSTPADLSYALWVLYQYGNYQDQDMCLHILQILYDIATNIKLKDHSQLEQPFRAIFRPIFYYYHQNQHKIDLTYKVCDIYRCLHAGCYSNKMFDARRDAEIVENIHRQFTPEMYGLLFREAPKRDHFGIIKRMVKPCEMAFHLVKYREDYDLSEEVALEFICLFYNFRNIDFIKSSPQGRLLKPFRENLIVIKTLRHDSRRAVSKLANQIVEVYYKYLSLLYKE